MQQRRSQSSSAFNADTSDSPAQRDRARLIHSAAFRRLQSKTQVLSVGENDFYRTRLTHTLEVAQIGSGISEALRDKYQQSSAITQALPSFFQIEAICLAHDIGHPPFGHGGEAALNYFMHQHGGFEGNGQTLRIAARLGEYSQNHGLDLTRRTLLGLLKYPVLHRQVAKQPEPCASTVNLDAYKPPKCIHDDEEDILAWILEPFAVSDRERFCQVQNGRSQYKAFDTSIMELADDISYGIHDLEDAIALQLLTERQWQQDVIAQLPATGPLSENPQWYTEQLFSGCENQRKYAISRLVGQFVPAIEVREQGLFGSALLDLQAFLPASFETTLALLKAVVFDRVIKSPSVQALEYKGQQMVLRLFEVLRENPRRLLPKAVLAEFEQSHNPSRVICDYLASMTDQYANRLFTKLFNPEMGSVFDRV